MRTPGRNARTRLGTTSVAAILLLLGTTPGRAQETLLLPGDSVRVSMASRTEVYAFVRADSVSLHVRDGQTVLQLPISQIDRIEQRAPRPPGRSGRIIMTGAGAGVAAGFLLGALGAEEPGSDCRWYCPSRGDQMAMATLLLGGLGLVIGGVVALADAHSPYWRPVDSGGLAVAVAPTPAGGVGVAVRWTWSGQRGQSHPR